MRKKNKPVSLDELDKMIATLDRVVEQMDAAAEREQSNRDTELATNMLFDAVDRELDLDTIRTWIDRGADVNAVDDEESMATLLHMTVDPKVATLLVESGIDVGAKDANGETTLDLHRSWQRQDLVQTIQQAITDRDRKALTASLESTFNLPPQQRSQSSRQRL